MLLRIYFLSLLALMIFLKSKGQQVDTTKIYTIVDQPPTFGNDLSEFYKIIGTHIKYPKNARKIGIEGRVVLSMVIRNSGQVTDIKVEKGIGMGCDEAAIEAIKAAGPWQAAQHQGIPVHCHMTIPIAFSLPENGNPLIWVNGSYLGRLKDVRSYFQTLKDQDVASVHHTTDPKLLKKLYKEVSKEDEGVLIFLNDSLAKGNSTFYPAKDSSGIFFETVDTPSEKPPTYPGGTKVFYAKLGQVLQHPKIARTLGIQGKVVVSFVIAKDGTLRDFTLKEGQGFLLYESAVDAIRTVGRWNPALVQGKPVSSKMTIPVHFHLQSASTIPLRNPLVIVNGEYRGRLEEISHTLTKIKAADIQKVSIEKNHKKLLEYFSEATKKTKQLS